MILSQLYFTNSVLSTELENINSCKWTKRAHSTRSNKNNGKFVKLISANAEKIETELVINYEAPMDPRDNPNTLLLTYIVGNRAIIAFIYLDFIGQAVKLF